MATKKTTLGRVPTYAGDFDPSYVNPKTGHNGYPLKKRVTMYGSEFQSLVEDNTYPPAELNAAGTQITFDTLHWQVISNGSDAYLFEHRATARMAEIEAEQQAQRQEIDTFKTDTTADIAAYKQATDQDMADFKADVNTAVENKQDDVQLVIVNGQLCQKITY